MIDPKELTAMACQARHLMSNLDLGLVIARDLMSQIGRTDDFHPDDIIASAKLLAEQAMWVIDALDPALEDMRAQLAKTWAGKS